MKDCSLNSSQSSAARPGGLSRVWSRIAAWFVPPLGYEDEAGFHYGVPVDRRPAAVSSAAHAEIRLATDRSSDVMKHPAPVTDLPSSVPTEPAPPAPSAPSAAKA
jgi:hypothetical protein